jgi:hypothetical protein
MEFEKKRGLGVCRNGKRRLHKHLSDVSVIYLLSATQYPYRFQNIKTLSNNFITMLIFIQQLLTGSI